jgi:hypothetical protein
MIAAAVALPLLLLGFRQISNQLHTSQNLIFFIVQRPSSTDSFQTPLDGIETKAMLVRKGAIVIATTATAIAAATFLPRQRGRRRHRSLCRLAPRNNRSSHRRRRRRCC